MLEQIQTAATAPHSYSEFNNEGEMLKPRLVRIKEAAAYLGLSTWSVRNLVQKGKLPVIFGDGTYAPWRFDVCDLDHYIESHKQVLQ